MKRKIKKIVNITLAGVMALSLVGCGGSSSNDTTTTQTTTEATTQTTTQTTTQAQASAEKEYSTEFVLKVIDHMREEGYEDIVLDEVPQNVVCLSTAPVLALYEMGANVIMAPSTTVIDYPADLGAEIITAITSDKFDLEYIIAAEPDLIFIPASGYAQYGELLESAGIPCHIVAGAYDDLDQYDIIKQETQVFTDAFIVDAETEKKAEAVMQRFVDLEKKIEEAKPLLKDKVYLSTMISGGTSFFVQQETSTLGSVMKRLELVNAYTPIMGESMAPVDLEHLVDIDLDVMIFVSATMDPEITKQTAIDAMANQQEVWDSISAITDGHVLYLTTNYWSFGG
ncbi:MAG: ABC transporter substrate-binding protein, partial [bacterium]